MGSPVFSLQGVKLEPFQSQSLCIEYKRQRIPKKTFFIAIFCMCGFSPQKFIFPQTVQIEKNKKQKTIEAK